MARLFLRYEQSLLKVFPLPEGEVTIGRLPDNMVQVDNPAVSGHHARIYFDSGQYVLEDSGSRNGTFVNGKPISRVVLQDEDEILICKHTLMFKDEKHQVIPQVAQMAPVTASAPAPVVGLDSTMMLDTRRVKEILAHGAASCTTAAASTAPASVRTVTQVGVPAVLKERIGILTVLSGKTDQQQYVLGAKLNAIGKSDMASIKLKGWFKPKLAAVINRGDQQYHSAPSVHSVQVKVNQQVITSAQELKPGDEIELCGTRMKFAYNE
jgi:predicted component of type VI protein secretion system